MSRSPASIARCRPRVGGCRVGVRTVLSATLALGALLSGSVLSRCRKLPTRGTQTRRTSRRARTGHSHGRAGTGTETGPPHRVRCSTGVTRHRADRLCSLALVGDPMWVEPGLEPTTDSTSRPGPPHVLSRITPSSGRSIGRDDTLTSRERLSVNLTHPAALSPPLPVVNSISHTEGRHRRSRVSTPPWHLDPVIGRGGSVVVASPEHHSDHTADDDHPDDDAKSGAGRGRLRNRRWERSVGRHRCGGVGD